MSDIHAFSPVMAVYSGMQDEEKVLGIIMLVGLSAGNEAQAMVLNTQGVAVRISLHMRSMHISDWSIELDPFKVNRYLARREERSKREEEEREYPLLSTQTLQDEEVGNWMDEV